LKARGIIGQAMQALQDENLEHEHRVEARSAAGAFGLLVNGCQDARLEDLPFDELAHAHEWGLESCYIKGLDKCVEESWVAEGNETCHACFSLNSTRLATISIRSRRLFEFPGVPIWNSRARARLDRGAFTLSCRYMKTLLALLLVGLLSSCVTPPGGPMGGPQALTVQMPADLDQREAAYMGEIASVLQRRGYQPVNGGYALYRLDFSIETGPVNADATLTLTQGPRVIAEATGRDGGPRIIFDREGVVRSAMTRCLEQFEPQLRGAPGYFR
jgi:hypothetical protein